MPTRRATLPKPATKPTSTRPARSASPGHLIGPGLFSFLADLAQHNDRDWFATSKERYETQVRLPLLAFVDLVAPRLARISPSIVADPRPVGGSLFRIQRDIRFSKDKSPYKTHAALHFRHKVGKDVHSPGYYLHLEPGKIFMGGGLYAPDSATLNRLRQAIVDDPAGWKKAVGGARFRAVHTLWGESLTRPPRGVPANHPLMEDLKRKHFVAMATLEQKVALQPDFLDVFAGTCTAAAPLMAFLCGALGLEW